MRSVPPARGCPLAGVDAVAADGLTPTGRNPAGMGRSAPAAAAAAVAPAVGCGTAGGVVGLGGAGALADGLAGPGAWHAASSATPVADTSSLSAVRRLILEGMYGTTFTPLVARLGHVPGGVELPVFMPPYRRRIDLVVTGCARCCASTRATTYGQ